MTGRGVIGAAAISLPGKQGSIMKNAMLALSRFMSILGGLVLSFLILLTCVSIAGRLLNGLFHSDFMTGLAPEFSRWMIGIGIGPVTGDFELVEAGCAFAIFAFIPLCQMTAGHASVDVFVSFLSERTNSFLRMVTEAIFALVLVVIAVQLANGMVDKIDNRETSFLIAYPIWWAYALSLFGAIAAAIVGVYMAVVRVCEFFTRSIIIPEGTEAGH